MEETKVSTLIETGQPYKGSTEECLHALESNVASGLSKEEAKKRLEQFGVNKLEEEEAEPLWKKILAQFNDVMVIILILAAIVSGFLGDWIEAVIIIAIVIVNAILGVVQEGRAEQAVAALQKMSAPLARVLREGKQELIDSQMVVPGDIIILEAGDIVPADLRLLEASNLKAEEAALTGESVPVEKDAHFETDQEVGIGDRHNMVFSSTAITYGRATAVAVATGQSTEMGKIAGRLSGIKQELTPLQTNINTLGKYLAIFCLVVVIITFAVGIMNGGDIMDMFMTSVSLAVAAIPEGLAAVITIVLALGMNRMAAKNSIVKRLLAVETLGSVNVICSDKTGTLTQNEMTVTRLYVDGEILEVSGSGYDPTGQITYQYNQEEVKDHPVLHRLLEIGVLCNEAELQERDGVWGIIGDPTEAAMLSAGAKGGLVQKQLTEDHERLGDLPFDSERKMMSVFHAFPQCPLSLTKGAPDIVLERCNRELTKDGVVELTQTRRDEIMEANSAFAQTALRVLAFAYSEHPDNSFSRAENDMIFVGLMGMIDPARPEARDAIAVCTDAGIRAVMITGDYKDTAVAIARDLGLMKEGDKVLTGKELDALNSEELRVACENTAVYARVSPEHKVRIVEALQANGHIASMTGDGVNDAPALKRADIGVAMGITGTEVAKGTADMILTDDNFATIVTAVEEGRVIYSNIRKFVGFLLSCNVGEILVIFITMMVMGPSMIPLMPIQLLWLNLVTDSFPALALGQEKAEPDIMLQPPRKRTDKILNKEMILSITFQAIAIFLAVFIAFNIGISNYGLRDRAEDGHGNNSVYWEIEDTKDIRGEDGTVYKASEKFGGKQFGPSTGAMSYAFITLIAAELLRSFSSRSEHYSVFTIGLFSNATLNKALLIAMGLTVAVIYVPFLQPIFETRFLGFEDWAYILPLSLLPFVVGELFKLIYHRKSRAMTSR